MASLLDFLVQQQNPQPYGYTPDPMQQQMMQPGSMPQFQGMQQPAQQPMQGMPQMPQGGGMDPAGLSQRIQELLGAKQPDQGGLAQDILGGRFQPSIADESNAIIKSAPIGAGLQTGQDVAEGDFMGKLKMLNSLSETQKNLAMGNLYNAGGQGNATIKAAQQIMAENPGMTFSEAFSFAKSGLGQGVTYQNGQVTTMQGAPSAAGAMAAGKEAGQKGVELGYAGPIAAASAAGTIQGKGEITPVQQLGKGQNQVSKLVGDISGYYDDLNAAGGAVNTSNTPTQNFFNYLGNTPAGQLGGKMTGSETQSIRNKITQAIPGLINAIRQSTGMSAKAMDSNVELKFYLQQASDPTLDIQANKAALARIEQMFGQSGGMPQAPAQSAPAGGANPQPITPEQAAAELDRRKAAQGGQ